MDNMEVKPWIRYLLFASILFWLLVCLAGVLIARADGMDGGDDISTPPWIWRTYLPSVSMPPGKLHPPAPLYPPTPTYDYGPTPTSPPDCDGRDYQAWYCVDGTAVPVTPAATPTQSPYPGDWHTP
jgi:hypothetical protein